MSHRAETPRYHAFLLRCWRENTHGASWRFSLERAGGERRSGFADLGDVIATIQAILADTPADDPFKPTQTGSSPNQR